MSERWRTKHGPGHSVSIHSVGVRPILGKEREERKEAIRRDKRTKPKDELDWCYEIMNQLALYGRPRYVLVDVIDWTVYTAIGYFGYPDRDSFADGLLLKVGPQMEQMVRIREEAWRKET